MRFIILFQDNPNADPDLRTAHMEAHLQFLERHKDIIDAAGPLHALNNVPAGGLWLVECDTADDAERLVKEDPFWPTGLRASYQILAWTQVFANGQRRIRV